MKKQVINNIRLVIYNNDGKEMQLKEPRTGMGALLQDGDAFVFNKEGRITKQYSPNPVFYRGNVLTSRVLKDGKYIGELKLKESMGDDVSAWKITDGSSDIAKALEKGETLTVTSQPKKIKDM